jgi:hypothetical protein
MNRRTPQALAAELRQKAQNLRPGADKDHLLREARHLETMASAKEWASSIELQPPVSSSPSGEH